MTTSAKPITIRGITYGSHRAAERALGLRRNYLSVAKHRGYALDRVGLRCGRHDGSPSPTTIHGVTYPSREAAAKAYGVSKNVIIGRAYRGTLDRLPKLRTQDAT